MRILQHTSGKTDEIRIAIRNDFLRMLRAKDHSNRHYGQTRPCFHGAGKLDLMTLAGFCRNCLSKWYKAAADDMDIALSMDEAREAVYGMPYAEWKDKYQQPATPQQLEALEARQKAKEQL